MHEDWTPKLRHAIYLWLWWLAIIGVVIFAFTDTNLPGAMKPYGQYRGKVSANGTQNSESTRYSSMGNGMLVPPASVTYSAGESPYLAPRIGWTRYPAEQSTDLLQRTFGGPQSFNPNAGKSQSSATESSSTAVRPESTVFGTPWLDGGNGSSATTVPSTTTSAAKPTPKKPKKTKCPKPKKDSDGDYDGD